MDVKSEEFQKQVQELRGQCEALLNVLESEETMEDLKEGKNFNIESLSKNFGVWCSDAFLLCWLLIVRRVFHVPPLLP